MGAKVVLIAAIVQEHDRRPRGGGGDAWRNGSGEPRRNIRERFGPRNACMNPTQHSLRLPQEAPTVAYQETHHRLLSPGRDRIPGGKSLGGIFSV